MDANVTIVDVWQNLNKIIESIATKLEVTVDQLMQIYTKNAIIEGYSALISGAILIGIGSFVSWFSYKQWNNIKNSFDADASWCITFAISAIITVIGSIIYFVNFPFILTQIINPQAYAITKIMTQFSSLLH